MAKITASATVDRSLKALDAFDQAGFLSPAGRHLVETARNYKKVTRQVPKHLRSLAFPLGTCFFTEGITEYSVLRILRVKLVRADITPEKLTLHIGDALLSKSTAEEKADLGEFWRPAGAGGGSASSSSTVLGGGKKSPMDSTESEEDPWATSDEEGGRKEPWFQVYCGKSSKQEGTAQKGGVEEVVTVYVAIRNPMKLPLLNNAAEKLVTLKDDSLSPSRHWKLKVDFGRLVSLADETQAAGLEAAVARLEMDSPTHRRGEN